MSDKPTYEELEQRVQELDIAESEYKQALEASQEKERRIRSLFDGIPVGLYRTAEDGRILDANPALAEMLGFSDPQSLLFLDSAQFLVKPEEQIKQRNILKQGGVLHGYEVEFRRRDGSTFWVRDSARVFRGPDGKDYYEGSLEDITERKRSEEVLRESEERFRVAKEASLDSFLTFRAERDAEGRIVDFIFTDVNSNTEHMLQLSREHVLGKRMCEELPINRTNGFFDKYKTVVETGVPLEEEFYLPDTHVPAAWYYHQVVKLGDGIAILHRDVTDRKLAEGALRESEEKYRRIYENSVVGFFQSTPEGRFLDVNPAFAKMLGYESPEELVSSVSDIASQTYANPKDRSRYHKALQAHGYVEDFELKVRRKDGSEVWLSDSSRVYFDEGGKAFRYEGIVVDITDRKRAEDALRGSEALMARSQAIANVGSWTLDLTTNRLTWSDETYRIFGFVPQAFAPTYQTFLDAVHPDDRTAVGEAYSDSLRKGRDRYEIEHRIMCRDTGEVRYVHERCVHEPDEAGTIIRSIGYTQDITERKQTQSALMESKSKLSSAMELSHMASWEFDVPTGIFTFNDQFYDLYCTTAALEGGYQMAADVYAKKFVHPDEQYLVAEEVNKALMATEPDYKSYLEHRIIRGDGEIRDIAVVMGIIKDEHGRTVRTYGANQDITERKRAEEAIRKSEQEKSLILDNASEIIAFHNKDRRFIWANRAYLDGVTSITGLPATIGDLKEKKCYEAWGLTRVCTNCPVSLAIETGKPQKGELTPENQEHWPAAQGSWMVRAAPVRDSIGALVGVIEISNDITERKAAEAEREKLQARLAQAQKMESIGTLAGGIAHDFNNILSIIVGNTELAMLDVPEWSPAQDNLQEVREATLRARELIKQILLFARQKEHTVSNIHLEPIAKESLKMLRASIPSTVEIRENIEEGLPPVLADPSQIQQIIMNLCTNAGQVMEADGGILTFRLDTADTETPLHTMIEALPPGRYVSMQVKDTGPGIPPENLEKLFDPFFTTKGVGEGTGLGLAVVHGIVQDRKGGITVESEEGRGTTFTIYLPASDVPSAEVTVEQKWELPRGTERILFVDDEAMILKLGQRMLERLGYTVETRASGKNALECFRQDPHRFDLVVTDMTMPGMRGDRLAEEILAIRPDIPVILCTGYSRQISKEKAREIGIRAFVMKPLTQHELANTVREVLDEKPRR